MSANPVETLVRVVGLLLEAVNAPYVDSSVLV
jgi:hypothetical protein